MDILYHYTDEKGFYGIIDSESLWLTQVDCSNDLTECTLQYGEMKTYLEREVSNHPSAKRILSTIEEKEMDFDDLNKDVRTKQYAFSLTNMEDSSEHWEKFGDCSRGFSIGFDRDVLERMCKIGHHSDEMAVKFVKMSYTKYDGTYEQMNKGLRFLDNYHGPSDPILEAKLLHRDMAICRKESIYSEEKEIRLSYSDEAINGVRNFAESMGLWSVIEDLNDYLKKTGVEKLCGGGINPLHHSLSISNWIKNGLIRKIFIGEKCKSSLVEMEDYLRKKGIVCEIIKN